MKIIKNKWVWAAVAVIVIVAWATGIFSPADVPTEVDAG
jgi:hypothetical protein